MSLGAPNALAAVGAAPRTGGLFPQQGGQMPHTGGPMQGQQATPMAGLLGPGWSWGAQPMQFAGASVPQPFIDASPQVRLPFALWGGNGDVLSTGWRPADPYFDVSGYRFYGETPYITPRRSSPMPPPTRGGAGGGAGGGADSLNALVLAALGGAPAQQNNTADANIRRFMGIGQ